MLVLECKEWLLGTSCVQPEEKERIMKFVFKKDAKSALVSLVLSIRDLNPCYCTAEGSMLLYS